MARKKQRSEQRETSNSTQKTASSRFSASESTADAASLTETSNPDIAISQPAKSSWRQLFSFTRRSHVAPLIAAIVASGIVAASKSVLAVVLGRVFDVIAEYDLGTSSAGSTMSHISRWSLILVGIGVGNWMANSAFLALWIAFGELQASAVRYETFSSLLSKDMTWFDSQAEGISSLLIRVQT